MAHRKLEIEYRPFVSLRIDPHNPRSHSPRQIKQIARSIQEFGFNVPILVDRELKVIAGHGRLEAAQQLGLSEIPTITIDHLSNVQVRAFMIADNRLTENSDWNEEFLATELKILSLSDLNFSLDITGFEMSEIDLILEGAVTSTNSNEEILDIIDASRETPTASRLNDIWILDRHRLLCGDARDAQNYSTLTRNHLADTVFTDPPYNDPIDDYVAGFGQIHHPEFAVASGELSQSEFKDFLTTVFQHLAHNSVDGALQFICMDWGHSVELLAAARVVYADFKNLCVWVKDSAGQGSLYRSQHELVFVFKSGTKPHRNNIKLGQFGRYRTNVWQYRRVNSLSGRSGDENLSGLHPKIKPVEMVADAILDCTARNDIVLDPFSGTGTTLIACERIGRICYGMELEPRYVDIIVRRWQSFTGQCAFHEATGKSFAEMEVLRDGRTE